MKRAKQLNTTEITETSELDIQFTKSSYQRLKRAIDRSADRVENAVDGADEKELIALERNLNIHHKMLDNLMKMEGGLNAGQSQPKNTEIDLDAARIEIVERLSRIRAAT